ncbi:hypothetical protein [Sporolactobacillus inulinus]|uniref:hypothetical protein n=1 Tax=Sporolactobacillus inulinus TaxID=2078 RepID=UPI0021CC7CB8|nr:hypothetical protein [Sporolactobacillus inulinus]
MKKSEMNGTSVLAKNQSGGALAPAGSRLVDACQRDPAELCLFEEARGAPAASEQPKRRFSTEKARVHHTWLEVKDRVDAAKQ